ncbi:ANTAR domain-containing protein [Actinokineospora sp. NBRC 105648]|uniref:ANTAR domain-containing protein n=1 Tax=Actinokineospora sp. NBRC 105648 TaxID=3032206 RepID=UPI002555C355|nr:ANTAR domain-containing protein [Actinokineospora sp. NBRC 105648]
MDDGVFAVTGDLPAAVAARFRTELFDLVEAWSGDVIVDLAAVSALAAANIRVLLDVADRLAGTGRRLRLAGGVEAQRVLRAARVTDTLETFATVAGALGAQAAASRRVAAAAEGDELRRLREEVRDLRAKLRSRPLIARALGMLQERYRLADEDVALRLLKEAAQRYNLKLHVFADALLSARPPVRPATEPANRPPADWFPGRIRPPAPGTPALGPRHYQRHGVAVFLDAVLDAALACVGATAGDIRLVDPAAGGLRLERHRGLGPEFVSFFADADGLITPCATAMSRGTRVVVADVALDSIFAGTEARRVFLDAGALAVQSTPVLTPSGRCLGVVSTHQPVAGRVPTPAQEAELDLIAADAGEWLRWHQRTTILDALEHLHRRAR